MPTISLDPDTALVLFDLLSRFDKADQLAFEDGAEKVALWHLLCALERILTEPLAPNYRELLNLARDRLNNQYPE